MGRIRIFNLCKSCSRKYEVPVDRNIGVAPCFKEGFCCIHCKRKGHAKRKVRKSKKKTKKQLKAEAKRLIEVIEEIENHPRTAFRNSCAVTCKDDQVCRLKKALEKINKEIERKKIMKAKKVTKKTVARKSAKSDRKGIRGKSGFSVCHTWIRMFDTKSIKTKAACTKKMKGEFPKRKSAVFNHPNTVKARANRGLLDGKKHKYAKYAS